MDTTTAISACCATTCIMAGTYYALTGGLRTDPPRIGTGALWTGHANMIIGLDSAHKHLADWPVSAVIAGLCYWLWWNLGGKNKTKRRLKKIAQAFKGVRRTAPVVT